MKHLSIAAVVVPALLLSCGGGVKDRHNIVFISIDTLRADHLGCYGYFRDTSPVIDSLASESVLFERCLAPMATTLPSHLSLMTGTYPVEHGVMANVGDGGKAFVPSPSIRTFAEFASEAGYATAAFISATPLKRHSGIAAGFDVYDEPPGAERDAAATTDAVLRWLPSAEKKPFFLWVHYYDPHAPYEPPADLAGFFKPGVELDEYMKARRFPDTMVQFDGRSFPTVDVVGLYDEEIRSTDRELGRLLDALRGMKAWKKTIIVLVGDHGEGLGQHMQFHHGLVWDEQLHVPLLFRVPGEPPARIPEPISITDVIPTLFAYIDDIPSGSFLEQASGVNRLFDTSERSLLSQSSARRRSTNEPFGEYALTTEKWKYVYNVTGGDRLFDLESDPYELVNLVDRKPSEAAALKMRIIEELEAGVERGARFWGNETPRTRPLEQKTKAELKALGYVD